MRTVLTSLVGIAFNIIASLFGISLLASYLVSILTLIYRRLKGDPLPPKVFSLGRFGLPINILTVVFDSFSLVMVRTEFFVTYYANGFKAMFPCCAQSNRGDFQLRPVYLLDSLGTGDYVLHRNCKESVR